MIFGTGVDIIEIYRIKRAIANQHFIERVFTKDEICYCESRGAQATASYAARFAGKEAVLKAFGTGLRGGSLLNIEILPDEEGCPTVTLFDYYAAKQQSNGITAIHLSLSHSREYAIAQAICWRD